MSTVLIQSTSSTTRMMTQVMLALVPGTAMMSWYMGSGVLINIAVITLVAVACEALVLNLRKRQVITTLSDGSIVLAAWLLAICLPPSLPISQLIIGGMAMALLGKHFYGGLGQNPFNPAMVGYAVLLISFPQSMTLWLDGNASLPPVDTTSTMAWWQVKWQASLSLNGWDAITQATPLDRLRNVSLASSGDTKTMASELFATSYWWKVNGAWAVGGVYLLLRGVIRWHMTTLFLLHLMHQLINPLESLPAGWAMVSGGVMLGAFFIATDPVSAPSSRAARLCYGAGIGLFIFVLRSSSNYPEGVAFAVLLMNATVPLLDRLWVTDGRL